MRWIEENKKCPQEQEQEQLKYLITTKVCFPFSAAQKVYKYQLNKVVKFFSS